MLAVVRARRCRVAVWALVAAGCGDPASSPRDCACAIDDAAPADATSSPLDGAQSLTDCTYDQTVPGPGWLPTTTIQVPVVVHVITDADCTTGDVSDALIASQIAVLDEDFAASGIDFVLVETTRDCDATWYQDDGDYWTPLARDPARFLNLYTNTAGGSRGYVPSLPAAPDSLAGQVADRVVINWLAFGRPGPFPPHDQGRTATHEIGHYLGLFHPYFEGCGVAAEPDCYTTGDRICDTPPDQASHDGCPVGAVSCDGTPVPIANFMELTDDACMTEFTAEQTQRMRCTLATYRPLLVAR
jgi:hypothetical protein